MHHGISYVLYLTNSSGLFFGGEGIDMVQNVSLFFTISVSITIALPPLEDFRGHIGSVNRHFNIF